MIKIHYLEHLKELCKNATPGPWTPLPKENKKWVTNPAISDIGWQHNHDNDAAFVAEARRAIPLLIKALENCNEALNSQSARESRFSGRYKAVDWIRFTEEG